MKILQVCPPHLSDVATLPREIKKSHFQHYYSYIILIIYVISEKKQQYCRKMLFLDFPR